MKTLLIPLDERPCNRVFPEMIGKTNQDIDLLVPDMDLFGHKKEPTDTKQISDFLLENSEDCDNVVLSIDMILYGGLIPSRIHHLTREEALSRLSIIKKLKQINPKMKIYAFLMYYESTKL